MTSETRRASAPLVVTLELEPVAQRSFDDQRARLFPAGRTRVGAHVTLFHAVPGQLEADVRQDLAQVASTVVSPLTVAVTGVRSLGRGAAYWLECAELSRLHRELQRRWWPHLTHQDQQGFRPHVTVQNKVEASEARRTVAALQADFTPYDVLALGLRLWRYDDGPWTSLCLKPFRDA